MHVTTGSLNAITSLTFLTLNSLLLDSGVYCLLTRTAFCSEPHGSLTSICRCLCPVPTPAISIRSGPFAAIVLQSGAIADTPVFT